MLKNWKSLFVKTEGEEAPPTPPASPSMAESMVFPTSPQPVNMPVAATQPVAASNDVNEVLQVYEQGLDSINMPGYDFFEFYKAVNAAGHPSSQLYNMAFQMASTMDKTVTVQKLVTDAEFYISKINEVHSQYTNQGQQKLHTITDAKGGEKSKLAAQVEQANMRIAQLRVELQNLEREVHQNREALAKVDDAYAGQERGIKAKLAANDQARQISIAKLNAVKDGINTFIK